jgi:hypothetical protein
LQELRRAADLNMRELAPLAGLNPWDISDFERGRRKLTDDRLASLILAVLDNQSSTERKHQLLEMALRLAASPPIC